MNSRVASALLSLVVFGAPAWAENGPSDLSSFTESFEGKGEYSASGYVLEGFDVPYWALTLKGEATAEFTKGGLRLSNEGDSGLSQAILTRHIGGGSFQEEIRLNNVALGPLKGDPADSFAQLILLHTTDAGGHLQLVFIENDRYEGNRWMSVLQDSRLLSDREAAELKKSVAAGKDIVLKMSWDQETRRMKIAYDNDATNGDNEEIVLANFHYRGAPVRDGSVSLILQRSNKGGAAAATVSLWRVSSTQK